MTETKAQTKLTVDLGTFDTKKELVQALRGSDKIEMESVTGWWASILLNQEGFKLQDNQRKLDLAIKTPADLGLEGDVSLSKTQCAAENDGLVCPPAEVAPQLILQYPNQLVESKWLFIAHAPITRWAADLGIFKLKWNSDGSRHLGGSRFVSGAQNLWVAEQQFVFVRP